MFGTDFNHQRHCIDVAVWAQISTIIVKGQMPLAGATSFRAEVVELRISGNAGRDLSALLLTVAAMDAIGEYLVTWETEERARSGGIVDQIAQPPGKSEDLPTSTTNAAEPDGLGGSRLVNPFERMSEHELLDVVYQTCYIMVRSEIESGATKAKSETAMKR